jgi:hypothetical protein
VTTFSGAAFNALPELKVLHISENLLTGVLSVRLFGIPLLLL